MIKKISDYLSLVKFVHTIFAMPFALIGFFVAIKIGNSPFSWHILILVILCMIFARNAAMAFNRYADRKIDSLNPRTVEREIPKGIISPHSALLFISANVILFMLTTWFINMLTFALAPVALLIILGYSLAKRYTSLCHFVLGLGLSLAPIGAYISVCGKFGILPIMYSLAVLFWVSGFDMIYSLQDYRFDQSVSLKSMPAWLGKSKTLVLSAILHLFTTGFIIAAGIYGEFGLLYWIGSFIFISLLLYQHLIVKPDDLSRVNVAFQTINGIASITFAIFTIISLYLK